MASGQGVAMLSTSSNPQPEVTAVNELLLHPKIVHLPIALSVLMPLVAGGLAVAWWRGWLPKRAWAVAIVLQGILLVSGLAAMQTGEVDEEAVEEVVAERYLDAHEDAAEIFVWGSAAVFALVLGAGLIRRDRIDLAMAGAATVGTLVVLGLGYRVGDAGGRLVYGHGAASAYVTSGSVEDLPERLMAERHRGDGEDDDDEDGDDEDDDVDEGSAITPRR